MRVGEACTRDVVFCKPGTTTLEAAQIMRNSHVRSIVVLTRVIDREKLQEEHTTS